MTPTSHCQLAPGCPQLAAQERASLRPSVPATALRATAPLLLIALLALLVLPLLPLPALTPGPCLRCEACAAPWNWRVPGRAAAGGAWAADSRSRLRPPLPLPLPAASSRADSAPLTGGEGGPGVGLLPPLLRLLSHACSWRAVKGRLVGPSRPSACPPPAAAGASGAPLPNVVRRAGQHRRRLWAHRAAATSLYLAWAHAYNLSASDPLSPEAQPPPRPQSAEEQNASAATRAPSLAAPSPAPEPPHLKMHVRHRPPPAPHLFDCAALAAFQRRAEQRGPGGEMPWWDQAQGCAEHRPDPPWVRGSDASNLPLTRVAQRDLWAHQFPPGDCSQPRLAVVVSPPLRSNGLGSQLHWFSRALSLAMTANRVLVPFPQSFEFASNAECSATGHPAALSCYFAPLVSPACEARVSKALAAPSGKLLRRHRSRQEEASALFNESEPIVAFRFMHDELANAEERWRDAWLSSASTVDAVFDADPYRTVNGSKVHWWRSQSVRFLLRWPSPLLCRVSNAVRHEVFGRQVAHDLVESHVEARKLAAAAAKSAQAPVAEGQLVVHRLMEPSPLLTLTWPAQDAAASGRREVELSAGRELVVSRCVPSANATDAGEEGGQGNVQQGREAGARGGVAGRVVAQEPLLPRPLVSIHVRQGDKRREMRMMGLESVMAAAHRIKLANPFVRNVWLTTEMQSVINAVRRFRSWRFFFLKGLPRQRGRRTLRNDPSHTGTILATLLIAAQCDFFVGVLGSNWNRLINELRCTNGRLHAGYVAANVPTLYF